MGFDCLNITFEMLTPHYIQVKIYTDPYYRYLPPLSEASKRFDVRLARLPYKHVRDEKEWQKFLDVLNKPKEKPKPPKPPSPDFAALNRDKMDAFRRRGLPILAMPMWQNAALQGRLGRERIRKIETEVLPKDSEIKVDDSNLTLEQSEKKVDDSNLTLKQENDSNLTLKQENSFIGFNKDSG